MSNDDKHSNVKELAQDILTKFRDISIDLSKNSSTDELRVGLVLVNKDGSDNLVPDSAKILIEFSKNEMSLFNTFSKLKQFIFLK